MTQELTRIGRGVPPPKRPRKTRLNPAGYWILAAAVLIAVGGMVWAAYFLNPPSVQPAAAPSGLPVQTQIECESIRHQHELWESGRDELDRLPKLAPHVAEFETKKLADEGGAFLDSASGRDDAGSKQLAVAIAQYNLDMSTVRLYLVLGGGRFDDASYQKAVASWVATEAAYDKFLRATCGSA